MARWNGNREAQQQSNAAFAKLAAANMGELEARNKKKGKKKKKKNTHSQQNENPTEYLKSREWAAKKIKKLSGHGRYCDMCESPYGLEVYHLTYQNFGHESMDDLEILCKRCYQQRYPKES
jgi:hypothetical protein